MWEEIFCFRPELRSQVQQQRKELAAKRAADAAKGIAPTDHTPSAVDDTGVVI